METYRGHVRNPADAIKLFEACRLGLLPRVQRRLSEKERQSIQSGSVFVWDEREAGMRRWTDGKSWSASRVSGSFLTYREMEGKRGGGNFVPAPRRLGGKTPDSGRGSDEDADMDADGPDGYRYKADGLMKQSFSITTSTGQHLHLISYYTPRPHSTMADLPQPTTDPALRQIIPVKGMYPESTVHDSAPPMRTAPMPSSYMHLGQQMPLGPPPQALGRAPYPYPQGYGPWPPSPMATPPYNYPPAMYASQLPLPANGHPVAYPQYLPPHLQQHLPAQTYDRPSPLGPLPNTHDPMHRFPGQLPQMSAQPYGASSYNGGERHLSEPSIQQRPMAYMNQMPGVDNRLPPPLQHQNSAPQQSQTNGHHLQRESSSQGREQTSQQSQQSPRLNAILNSPKMDQATSIPSISNLVHAAEGPDASVPVPAASARQPSPAPTAQEAAPQSQILASPGPTQLSDSTRRISLVEVQQIARAADAARKAATPTRGSANLATAAAVAAIETLTGAKTPEIASAETTEAATPKEAGAPQDIPHEKLSFPGGAGAEDMRAIRVLDRKFCI